MDGTTLRLRDLSGLDRRELAAALPPECLDFEQPEAQGGEHGELATATAIVVVGVASLRLLAAWLVRARRSQKLTETVEIERPDGTRITRTMVLDLDEVDEPEAAVLRALSDLFPLDIGQIGPTA